ncbi:GDP/GTP exchange factor for ARF [Apophysomyces ossiformis]|uniref:GDP/GTP exchange factor for ARF n=1 Tax=Apophysomyces ossiformis TaxID=679940 RepID=A0A8H7BJV7_9FUNG|nr:GDP/GTP exchange factor for ARF [Apophysomyces ossiformis]
MGDNNIKSELMWSQLVHAEIIAVTSAMRKNARWSGMGVRGINMGNLGMNMGLRKKVNAKDPNARHEENPLMEAFANLKTYLDTVQDVRDVDALLLLNPFLEVIRSGNTTGPIAGTALSSVEKFLHYGIVGLNNPNAAYAMNALSSAATHCKFEASDIASDELVLLRMLQVLQAALTSECGQILSDEAVCEMMETGLSMCCQMRLSEMLRRSAEHVMINMVTAIFERLKMLDDDWFYIESQTDTGDENVREAPHMSTPKPSPSPVLETNIPESPSNDIAVNQSDATVQAAPEQPTIEGCPSGEPTVEKPVAEQPIIEQRSIEHPVIELSTPEDANNDALVESEQEKQDVSGSKQTETTRNIKGDPLRPYGVPAIRELLRVLISLLNPHEHKHTDSMRVMALSILNVAFEVGGRSIGKFEALRSLVVDDFCKYLFQLAKTDTTPLLTLTLRVISTVFDTMRPCLKLQHELFLFFLIERLSFATGIESRGATVDIGEDGHISFVAPQRVLDTRGGHVDVRGGSPNMFLGRQNDYMTVSGEVCELLMECLVQCSRTPTFLVDLWYNYDCDPSCGDLAEELVQFLSANSFPDPHTYSFTNIHVLCFDTLLMFINRMVDSVSIEGYDDEEYEGLTPSKELLDRKARKRLILEGSTLFNESPKKGIAFLEGVGIIEPDENGDNVPSLAEFLRSTQQLNKKILGEYLGKPENLKLLKEFMRQFEFEGKPIHEALRSVLETFRLPGESQQIMRVTDTFAEIYYEANTEEIANPIAAQVLAYSIIMLNTDQHNPQIRRRMSLEDYMRNLRGVNDNKDFSEGYLKDIYEAIRHDEIVMPEEHEGRLGFNYAWKQLLYRSNASGHFVVCDTASYNKDIFELTWKSIVAAISYAFNTAQDDATLQKAISGFHHCALLSSHFGLHDVFDSIVINLATMTGLLEKAGNTSSLPDPIVDVAGQKYVISNLAIRFGRDYKGQLAAVVMFAIVTRHGNSLRSGWTKILQIIRNLFVNSLLPSSMLQVEDFVSGTTSIPLKPKNPTPSRQQNRRDGSILSTLSAYLLSPYTNDETYRPDPTEEEVESTMCAVDCVVACRLEELFADISSGGLAIEPMQALMTAIQTVGYDKTVIENATSPVPYDPATVLFLEFMITTVSRNTGKIQSLWPYATVYMFGILENAEKQSVLVVERAVVGLLRLCICVATEDTMHDEILHCLRLLRDFPPSVTQAVAEQMMAGIFTLSNVNSAKLNDTEFINIILEIKQKVASSL